MKPGDLVFMTYGSSDGDPIDPEMGLIISYVMHDGSLLATDQDLHVYNVLIGDTIVRLYEDEMEVVSEVG